jgi:hypothetical protein
MQVCVSAALELLFHPFGAKSNTHGLRRFAAEIPRFIWPLLKDGVSHADSSTRLVRPQNLDRPDRGVESLARCAAEYDPEHRQERWENPW